MTTSKSQHKKLNCGGKILDLSVPSVMGVLNITPDSFSDGGQYFSGDQVDRGKVLSAVETMISEGADIIDLGGESTRPGAKPVSVQQELDRVIPVLEILSANHDSIYSVDTSTPQVMREAANAGANLINDVRALQRQGALLAAADTELPVCLMHMQNQPQTMQHNPQYQDVVREVIEFLDHCKQQALNAGIQQDQILLDPGFGFGKTLEHNLALFNGLECLAATNHPVVIGLSRKSMIGQLINADVNDRIIGSVTMAVLAAQKIDRAGGASILRVHDVKQTKQALTIWQKVDQSKDTG